MIKTPLAAPVIAVLVLSGASAAQAQTFSPRPTPPLETGAYVSLGVGGQPLTRSFGTTGTFATFNETGRYDVSQNIGAGMLVDIGGGYRFTKHLSAGVGVWNVRSKSAVAAAASIPDPLFFGRYTTVSATATNDLRQSTIGVNVFLTYTVPVADRFDFAISLGPTFVKTKLDTSGVTVTAASRTIALSTESQSKSGAKAGNFGIDFTYRINAMNIGVFARYAGGELDLPAVQKLKVGSAQAGGLIRYRF